MHVCKNYNLSTWHHGFVTLDAHDNGLFVFSFIVCVVVVAAADDNDIEIGHRLLEHAQHVKTVRACPILSAGLKICPKLCARILLQYAQHILDVHHLVNTMQNLTNGSCRRQKRYFSYLGVPRFFLL